MDEDRMIRIIVSLALTAIFSLIGWIIAWIFGLVWFFWFPLIIFFAWYSFLEFP